MLQHPRSVIECARLKRDSIAASGGEQRFTVAKNMRTEHVHWDITFDYNRQSQLLLGLIFVVKASYFRNSLKPTEFTVF